MNKKLCAVITAMAAMLQTLSASAQMTVAGNVSMLSGETAIRVDIGEQATGVNVVVRVYGAGDTLNYFDDTYTDSAGTAQFQYMNNGVGGEYRVTAKRTDTGETAEAVFSKGTNAGFSELCGRIRAAVAAYDTDPSLLEGALKDAAVSFGISLEQLGVATDVQIAALAEEFAGMQFSEDDTQFVADFANNLYAALVLSVANTEKSAERLIEVLRIPQVRGCVGIDGFPKDKEDAVWMDTLEDSAISALAQAMVKKGPYKTTEELSDALELEVLLAVLKQQEDIIDVLSAYKNAGMLAISFDTYNNLSETRQQRVLQLIAAAAYTSYQKVTDGFNSAVSGVVPTAPPSHGGGGGGTHSSGTGGGVNIIPQNTPAPAEEEELVTAQNIFSDMEHAKWAIEAVETLYKKGIVSGVGDGNFAPQKYITREEMAKIMADALAIEDAGDALEFADVDEVHWSYPYIRRAYHAKLLMGVDDQYFDRMGTMTREQAAAIVYRALKNAGITVQISELSAPFVDEDAVSAWAKEAVVTLGAAKFVHGTHDDYFEPQQPITRAETAKMVYDMLKLMNKA